MHLSLSLDRSAMTIIITLIMIILIFVALLQSSYINVALLLSLSAALLFWKSSGGKTDSFSSNCSCKIDDTMNLPVTNIIYEQPSISSCDRPDYINEIMADNYEELNKDIPALTGEKAYPWGSNQSYTDCYPGPTRDLNGCNINDYMGIDEANTRQVNMRTRDKKVIDGYVSKNSNYYKRHFSKELDESENKRWWGNDEY